MPCCCSCIFPAPSLSHTSLSTSCCSATGGYSPSSRPSSWIRPIRQGRSLPNPPAPGTSVLHHRRSPLPVSLSLSLPVEQRARLLYFKSRRSNACCLLGTNAGPAPAPSPAAPVDRVAASSGGPAPALLCSSPRPLVRSPTPFLCISPRASYCNIDLASGLAQLAPDSARYVFSHL